ncbi:diacylglycerol kinase catalytic subunit [Arthrobacter crystallopoietes BAB-32]|uniref:Diacylglycerol kinase catalytic subunit n=1 Tax=Arthrobacter crystallopoietes BAB-32 TaxID=1246476 RepID=N1V3I2_9MICC|nr:diacylglycerol kinase family protein [Arthrobacter crystallopoietes]EMY34637.1 diacylglycerol kinase catalytic subunit [Arthrobacter crystallopoietes BAB-32]
MTEPDERTPRRAAVVVNPIKHTDVDLHSLAAKVCRGEGWEEPLWLETTKDDPGHGMARQAIAEGVDLVIAAGGDGTVRCVAEELAGTNVPLGLLPLGTGNLLARNLDIAVDDPEGALHAALSGTERKIDVVHITVDHAQKAHVFLVMAGLGFDAALMGDTRDDLKDKVGWLAYVDAGIRHLPGKPARTRITIDDGKPFLRRLRSVMGGNCGKIVGGLEIFPGAKIDDGLLEIMTVAPRGRFGWFAVVAELLRRGKSKDPSIEYFQCRSAEIQTYEPQDVEIDGDYLGKGTHLLMRVYPNSLRVRMPYGHKDPAVLVSPEP